MPTEILTADQEGMPLDLVLWRRFSTEVRGRVEATYSRTANQNLAEFGPILPLGTKVEVDITTPAGATVTSVTVLRLWG